MSKRLRASMRAANKGRSLRPRASHPPTERPSEPLFAEPSLGEQAGEAESLAPASAEAALPAVLERLPSEPQTAAPSTTPPSDVRAKETVREPAIAEPAVRAPAIVARVEPAAVEPVAAKAAPAETIADDRDAPLENEVHPFALTVAVKAPASRRSGGLRTVRDEAPSKTSQDDLDTSSISAEFFRRDEDSVPPVEEFEEEEVEARPVLVLSPTTLARRARLRRLVAGVVAFAGVISIAVVGKTLAASKRPEAHARTPVTTVASAAPVEQKVAPVEQKVAAVEPVKAEPAKDEPAKVEPAKVEPAKAEQASEPAKAEAELAKADGAAAKPAASDADAAALKKETLNLLNRGKSKDAVGKAREAIAADPSDATSYLYLGSALQDSGKWKDGLEAYCECVRHATKGPVNECRAMGGHK